jgi:predicted nucleic acid-binding protein
MIFVDTSAWFAVYSLRDVNHPSAARAIRSFKEQLVTTNFIVDETLTLLRVRGENRRAVSFGKRLIDAKSAHVVDVRDADFSQAWNLFQTIPR